MRKKLTILTLLLTLTLSAFAQTGQQIRVYYKSGLVELISIRDGGSISHSRADLSGKVHDDYVTMDVPTDNGTRQFLFEDLDSMILPNGRCVVFNGGTKGQAEYSKESVCDVWPVGTPPSFANDGRKRSSFEGRFPGQGTGNVTFKWTENDRIRLDVGYQSRAENLSSDGTNASFFFDGADDLDGEAYTVYFPDRTVTIPAVQTQNGADNSTHIYDSGDCGVATATKNSDGSYGFTLTHKASYLCFLPHINYLPSARIDKIELTCSNAIAGTYDLSSAGLYNGTSTVNTITLNLNPQRDRDFFIGHNINTEQDSCAAYMVIAPQDGSRSFTVTYYITDTLSNVSKKFFQSFTLQPLANTVYPITCNIRDTEFRKVDLGLSCNWSNVNVDATDPSLYGTSFATDAEANAALLSKTVVTEWLMPDDDQEAELLQKCQWKWGEYNGQKGYIVTGVGMSLDDGNIHRIFLPSKSNIPVTPEECLAANSRPVETLIVDMGLPKGTKWAVCNVGAQSATEAGDYFAWAETETKSRYSESNYLYGTRNLGENFNISGTQLDAAFIRWGGSWRMPTKEEWEELINEENCSWSWSTINGVNGHIVTSLSNGNKIFLPAVGMRYNEGVHYMGSSGIYASATQGGNNSSYSHTLIYHYSAKGLYNGDSYYPFNSWSSPGRYGSARYMGKTIRPVMSTIEPTSDGMELTILTDSALWNMGNTTATLYGSLRSTTPIIGEIMVGIIVGDSAGISIKTEDGAQQNYRYLYSKKTSTAGVFNYTLPVYANIGYWYKSFVQTSDTIMYGKARHFGYEMVDLGLNTGTLWANMNLGAESPEESGYSYAWGETVTKGVYDAGSYQFSTTKNLGMNYDISGTKYDAAHVNLGNAWRLPTNEEMSELLNGCTWEYVIQNSTNGYRVTGPNGNSIFLPDAGFMYQSSLYYSNSGGVYMTATQAGNYNEYAYTLGFYGATRGIYHGDSYSPFNTWSSPQRYASMRYMGKSVRPVATLNNFDGDNAYTILTDSATWKTGDTRATIYGTMSMIRPVEDNVTVGFVIGENRTVTKSDCSFEYFETVNDGCSISTEINIEDNIGYWYRAYVQTANKIFYGEAKHVGLEMVNLNLPSGTLWANMNVGSNWPEECGNFYAWAETETKSDYSTGTYFYGTQNLGDNNDIKGTECDAARVNMGLKWRMPTNIEAQELLDHCTWTWVLENGVNGYRVTGTNGNSIFLPATGFRQNTSLYNHDSGAVYATSVAVNASDYAYMLGFYGSTRGIYHGDSYSPFNTWSSPQRYASMRYMGKAIRAVANR